MHSTGLASKLYLYTIVAGKTIITTLTCWECNAHFYEIKSSLAFSTTVPAVSYLFVFLTMYFSFIFIKRRARIEKKYYKIFIEHPTYLRNQRHLKRNTANYSVNFSSTLNTKFNSLRFYQIANNITIPCCTV